MADPAEISKIYKERVQKVEDGVYNVKPVPGREIVARGVVNLTNFEEKLDKRLDRFTDSADFSVSSFIPEESPDGKQALQINLLTTDPSSGALGTSEATLIFNDGQITLKNVKIGLNSCDTEERVSVILNNLQTATQLIDDEMSNLGGVLRETFSNETIYRLKASHLNTLAQIKAGLEDAERTTREAINRQDEDSRLNEERRKDRIKRASEILGVDLTDESYRKVGLRENVHNGDEAKERDHQLEKAFSDRYKKPNFEEDAKSSEILIDHVELINDATNRIRKAISEGVLDGMDPEEIFHIFHFLHTGKGDLALNIVASANYRMIEYPASYSIYHETSLAITPLKWDRSFEYGKLRTTPIDWLPSNIESRGALGIHEDDLVDFSSWYFNDVERWIRQAQRSKLDSKTARGVAYMFATVLDMAHLKKDGNGRVCEDWMVWLERQLDGSEPAKFLSSNGFRAPRSNWLVDDPLIRGGVVEQQTRINRRNDEVVKIRRAWFQNIREFLLQIDEEDLKERLKSDDWALLNEARKGAFRVLKGMARIFDHPGNLDFEDLLNTEFGPLIQFYETEGIRNYNETSLNVAQSPN